MAEKDMEETNKVVNETFEQMGNVVDETVTNKEETDVQQPGPGVDEKEETQQEDVVQSEADKGQTDTEASKTEASKTELKTDENADGDETDKKESTKNTGTENPNPGGEGEVTNVQRDANQSDSETTGTDTQSPGTDAATNGATNKTNTGTGDSNTSDENPNPGSTSTDDNESDKETTDPDKTDEKEVVDAGEIFTKAKEIIKRNNNFNSLLPGRHFKDKISETTMKAFYKEFVSYGATTQDEVVLLELFGKMFD